MQDIEAIYEALSAGPTAEGAPMHKARWLQTMARERSRGSVEDKLGAIRVAMALGSFHGAPIVLDLCMDPDQSVRQAVQTAALTKDWDGLPVLRKMASDADEELALTALERLVEIADLPASATARRLLKDPRPRVRAAAATLLGLVAGSGVQPDLRRLESDDDQAVREAAALAVQRIRGEVEKPGAEPPQEEPAVEVWAPLPAEMPTEAVALARLLGSVQPGDLAVVVEHLSRCDAAAVAGLPSRYRPGADRATARGIALAAALLPRPSWLSSVRRMSRDSDPSVRAAAATGIGATGSLGTVVDLGKLCGDGEGIVRAAGVEALVALCVRIERPELGHRFLQPLVDDEHVGEAARGALERLGSS